MGNMQLKNSQQKLDGEASKAEKGIFDFIISSVKAGIFFYEKLMQKLLFCKSKKLTSDCYITFPLGIIANAFAT